MIKINDKKMKFILTCILAVLSMGIIGEASAATYYVAPNGSDSGNGSISSPWANFNYAISQVSAGDTIIAKAGTYNQSITVSKSVTLQGTLDANGNRLSIIDPYVNVSGGWTHIGNGTYKKSISYVPWGLSVETGGKRYKIERITNSNTWSNILNKGTEHTTCYSLNNGNENFCVNQWDGFNALFTYNNGYIYIGFDDDSDVNNKALYVSTDGDSAIHVTANNATIKNFEIRAKRYGVYIDADNASVDNNKIIIGRKKVNITPNADNAVISNNIMTDQAYFEYIGEFTHGAQGILGSYANNYPLCVRYHVYNFQKFALGDDREQTGMGVWIEGDGGTITGNTMYAMREGMTVWTGASDVEISNNSISNMPSIGIGVDFRGASGNSSIHDNLIVDTNIAIRLQDWVWKNGLFGNNTNLDIYRNRIWVAPDKGGAGLYFHYSGTGGSVPILGTAWIYHNSISVGYASVQVSDKANLFTPRGMDQVYFINNIFSSPYIYLDYSYGATPGGYWYNWQTGSWTRGGTGNYTGTGLMWNTTTLYDFTPASSAVGVGIDISRQFTIDSTIHSTLSGFNSGYFTGSRPDMGAGESILIQTCTSFTYSDWGECQSNNTQTRTVTSSSPSGCTGGTPVQTQSCTYGSSALTILKTANTPTLDGNLTEYNNANSITFSPASGGNTVTVKSLWTSDALYLGINVTDTQLNASATTRDGSVWSDDSVEWFIDTYYDGGGSSTPNSAFMRVDDYQGIVSILNTKYDSQGTTSGTPSSSWNGTWQSAVKLSGTANTNTDTDSGYTIEIKIPWTSIGYSTAPSSDALVGMSFAINDKDSGGTYSKMWLSSAGSNQNASNWQKVSLSGTLTTADVVPPAPPGALMIR